MIDFIKGKVAYRGVDFVVLDVGGIGYQVYVTSFCTTSEEKFTMLFTHFVVREDAHLLYGFNEEKEFLHTETKIHYLLKNANIQS